MEEKKAFIFDTNFIIQHKQLDKVVENLQDRFSVYVTQVSIDERKAQQCREVKKKFDEVEQVANKNRDIVQLRWKQTYESYKEWLMPGIQKRYESLFGSHIIPFPSDQNMLETVLNRSYQKIPPFATDEKSSDKGFKDTLIWLSMLLYFKSSGEQEVVFVTDDAGFTKNETVLRAEFKEETGKDVEIKSNAYYKELLKPELTVPAQSKIPQITNPEQLREKIKTAVYDICYMPVEGTWGLEDWEKTFIMDKAADSEYIRQLFSTIEQTHSEHYLETAISATVLLDLDDRVSDDYHPISIVAIENLIGLYKEIMGNYPDLLPQFFTAVAAEMNQNYVEPSAQTLSSGYGYGYSNNSNSVADEDGDLPF